MRIKTLAIFALMALTLELPLILAPSRIGVPSAHAFGGTLHGRVYGYNMWNELRPLTWARIEANDGRQLFWVSSMDGWYEMFLPAGGFQVRVSCPGYLNQTAGVSIMSGSSIGMDFILELSGIPIPEYQPFTIPLIALLALSASMIFLRRLKRKD